MPKSDWRIRSAPFASIDCASSCNSTGTSISRVVPRNVIRATTTGCCHVPEMRPARTTTAGWPSPSSTSARSMLRYVPSRASTGNSPGNSAPADKRAAGSSTTNALTGNRISTPDSRGSAPSQARPDSCAEVITWL